MEDGVDWLIKSISSHILCFPTSEWILAGTSFKASLVPSLGSFIFPTSEHIPEKKWQHNRLPIFTEIIYFPPLFMYLFLSDLSPMELASITDTWNLLKWEQKSCSLLVYSANIKANLGICLQYKTFFALYFQKLAGSLFSLISQFLASSKPKVMQGAALPLNRDAISETWTPTST